MWSNVPTIIHLSPTKHAHRIFLSMSPSPPTKLAHHEDFPGVVLGERRALWQPPTRYAAIKTSPTMQIIDASMLDATYQKPSSTMGGGSARGCWCCSVGVESQPLYTTKVEILSAATRAPFGHQRDAFGLVVGKLQIKYRTFATFSNTRTKHVV